MTVGYGYQSLETPEAIDDVVTDPGILVDDGPLDFTPNWR